MDLLGGEVQRGVLADLLRVIGRAIGELARAKGRARIGQIFLAEEGEPLGIGGRYALRDCRASGFAQALLLVRGNAARHIGERRPEGALLGIVDDIGCDRHIASVQRHPRNRKPARQTGPRIGGLLGEITRNIAHPADVVPIFFGRGEAAARRQVGPEIAVAVEGHFPFGKARIADFGLEQSAQHQGVGPPLCAQRGTVDCLKLAKVFYVACRPCPLRSGRDRPQAGAALGAAIGVFGQPELLELVIVIAVRHRREPRIGRLFGSERRCRNDGKGACGRPKNPMHYQPSVLVPPVAVPPRNGIIAWINEPPSSTRPDCG